MKTILITAYAVHPYKGSEDGTGWNIIQELAKYNKLIVITRMNNIEAIEKYISENHPTWESQISFKGFDLPNGVLKIKKKMGSKAHVPYYYLWQYFVYKYIQKSNFKFDMVHCLNFHSDSHPQFLWKLGKPTVWGPIGHHEPVKKEFLLKTYGLKSYLNDRLFKFSKWFLRTFDFARKQAIKHTNHIIVINSKVKEVNKFPNEKTSIIPAIASKTEEHETLITKEKFTVLSAGRLHYMKGFDIALRSFARFLEMIPNHEKSKCELIIAGSGPEEQRLKKIANQLNIEQYIIWKNWVPFEEMKDLYKKASVFLFPSHEGAGMVVPEAMSYGLPVLVFENAGPGELVNNKALTIPNHNEKESIELFAQKLYMLKNDSNVRLEYIENGYKRVKDELNWTFKGELINQIYQNMITSSKPKVIAVFHPSVELYGADRILVLALKSLPKDTLKKVYLPKSGPLIDYLKAEVENIEIAIIEFMPIIYRSLFTPKGVAKFMKQNIKFRKFIKSEIKKYEFQSVYVNTLACSFILPVFKKYKIPSYIHVHEILEKPYIVSKTTAILSNKYAKQVVCVSNAVKNNLITLLPKIAQKSTVIYNGIPNKEARQIHQENAPKTFVLFGRIMPKKGQWYLVEALNLIPREHLLGRKFIIVGDTLEGNEYLKDDLISLINKYQLNPFIELKGFVSNIDPILKEADVCLVPSLMKDPFPTTVLEAMSAGKPIIATNHGGASEAITSGISGILIPPNNPNEFALQIIQLIIKPSLAMNLGRNAKKEFDKRFSIQSFHTNWKKFQYENNFILD